MKKFPKTLWITGPTATGKTALAVQLAREFQGEIISVDSRQVFRGMDLGTGKDLAEYGRVPYHLIDVADPGAPYDLFTFVQDAERALAAIAGRGRLPILCGGSTLYLDALLRGYSFSGTKPDMALRAELDALPVEELNRRLDALAPAGLAEFRERNNRLRVRRAIEEAIATGSLTELERTGGCLDSALVLGVYFPRRTVHERIEARLDARLAAGMVDEVARLHEGGVSWTTLERYGLEYRFIAEFLQGRISRDEMRTALLCHIRQFAKRQDIWFRKMEREGVAIHWLPGGDRAAARQLVELFLHDEALPPCDFRLMDVDYGKKPGKKG